MSEPLINGDATAIPVYEERFEAATRRGRYRLDAARSASLSDVEALCGSALCGPLDGALFLDTETTGLSGGAGTFVFLVGVAWFEGDEFVVRQWLLPDPAAEEAFLDGVAGEARRAGGLISFHGRGFDVPRLEERFLLAGRECPFEHLPHLDLLVGARRVFKLRTGSAALQNLEREVLDVRRLDDLPGAECPAAWYDYLKGRRETMRRVLEHNLLDLLSLPALLAALAEVATGIGPAPDLHGAGKALARAGDERRGLELQQRALGVARDTGLVARAHEEAARLLRRAGDRTASARAALAATRADPSLPGPWLALAKHAEHRARDYELAAHCVGQLERLALENGATPRQRAELRLRRTRLERKINRASRPA